MEARDGATIQHRGFKGHFPNASHRRGGVARCRRRLCRFLEGERAERGSGDLCQRPGDAHTWRACAAQQVTPADQEELMRAFVPTDESWAIQKSFGGGEGHRVRLEAPLRSLKSLAGGELVFRRSFDGVHKSESDRAEPKACPCARPAFRTGAQRLLPTG